MDSNTCFECNRLRYEIYTANVEHRWRDALKFLCEQEQHEKNCPMVNGLYKGLWQNAVVTKEQS